LRFKKTLFALEQGRADIARRRQRWRSWQTGLDPRRPVFIDETWIKTNMAPLRGWGPKGKRLGGFAPHGHWRTLTFLGALRYDRLASPCVFDGLINGECFRAYVEQQLLSVLEPGHIVVMNNLGSHRSVAIRQMIRNAGARLWYPPPAACAKTEVLKGVRTRSIMSAQPRKLVIAYPILSPAKPYAFEKVRSTIQCRPVSRNRSIVRM